jgi:hypothetical protein
LALLFFLSYLLEMAFAKRTQRPSIPVFHVSRLLCSKAATNFWSPAKIEDAAAAAAAEKEEEV